MKLTQWDEFILIKKVALDYSNATPLTTNLVLNFTNYFFDTSIAVDRSCQSTLISLC